MVLDARRWIERLLVDEQLLAGLAESTQQTLKLRLRQLAEHHLTDCDGDLAAYETIARLKRIARAIRQLLLAKQQRDQHRSFILDLDLASTPAPNEIGWQPEDLIEAVLRREERSMRKVKLVS